MTPDDLLGSTEVAALLGVSTQRVSQLAATAAFPEPFVVLAAGKIWLREDIERWARETGRLS